MKYARLTEEQQAQIREQTLTNIEAEHFSNSLAAERARASEQDDSGFVEQMKLLEAQHKALSAA